MFDVGLSELMVIAIVALVVIGPERLPKVARTAGHILGRLQRYVSDVKSDINREMQLDELKKLQQQVSSQVASLETSVTHEMREIESSVNTAVAPLTSEATTDAAVAPAPTSAVAADAMNPVPAVAAPANPEVQKS
ncbi:MAG: twin-arginine translocase subunit TatB [Rhodocyclales bacterium]|nr:twin-arginine translocase subunit TatB [Rhodocyclales bacterium]